MNTAGFMVFDIFLYSLACLSLGLLLMHWFGIKQAPSITLWISAFLFGQGTLAHIWLLLALAGWFYPIVVASFTVILVFAGAPILYKSFFWLPGRLQSLWCELRKESKVWWGVALLEAVFCFYFVTILGDGLTGDALSVYMGIPKLLAASHHFTLIPGVEFFQLLGLQGEMHYAALMSLGSKEAARLFDLPTLLAGAWMLLAICRKAGLGFRGLLIALAMFLTSFSILHYTGMGKVDRFAMALALAAIYWTMLTGFSWLTGYFTGIAIVAKLTYLPYFLPEVFFLAVWQQLSSQALIKRQDDSSKNTTRVAHIFSVLLPFGIGLFLAFLPFLLKTLFVLIALLDKERLLTLLTVDASVAPGTIPALDIIRFYFRFPFDATFMLYESLSPLILAFIPLAIFLPRRQFEKSTPLWAVTIAAIGSTTICLLFFPIFRESLSVYYGRIMRYFLPAVLLFIPLSARAAEYACEGRSRSRLFQWVIAGSVLLTLTTTLTRYTNDKVFFPRNTYRYIVQKITECDLPHEPNFCRVLEAFNRIAPPGARVLDASGAIYFFRPDLIGCMDTIARIPHFDQTEDLWQWIRRNGFQYLIALDYEPVLNSLVSSPLPPWVNIVLLLDDGPDGPVSIYRLNYTSSAMEPEKVCQQTAPGFWQVNDR